MRPIVKQIQRLAEIGEIRISEHGYEELAQDGLFANDVVSGLAKAKVVEEYPDYPKGPCVLVLEHDATGRPIHAVWGIPAGAESPAVLVTAYRPDADRWTDDFMRRKP
jgi:hypothetical protein